MKPAAPPVRSSRLLLRWYSRHARPLPWRATRNPYRVLVSEIMLQQTQVQRVLEAYPRFLRTFRSFPGLARASRRSVIVAWRGMGYNNRAVRLHRLAQILVRSRGAKLPHDEKALLRLPGVGPYTARAILVFAFGKRAAAVDINVRRVLSRLVWRMPSTASLRNLEEVRTVADSLVPRGRAYDWNQALMDLGATVCTAHAPRCSICPLSRVCLSRPSMREVAARRIRREPSMDGVPNRLYRGKIVETLRGSRRPIPLPHIGRAIHAGFAARHERWLQRIIDRLAHDGIVRVRGNGSFRSRMVSLV